MSVGCGSAKAVSSPLKGLSIHSLPWACISITDRPIVLELTGGEIRWAPFTQGAATSVHRWHCALSRLPSFVFHQRLFHRPSDHIYHFTLSPGDAPAQAPTYPNHGIALPSRLPPDQVQSPFSRNFPSTFRSNFSPSSPCSLALCSATLPSTLEMGRGQNSKSLLLESAQSGVERCDVIWWWSPWSSIWGAMSPEDGGTWSSLGLQKAAWRKKACWEEGTARTQAQRQESTQTGFMVCARLEEDASLLTSAAWRPPGQQRLIFVTQHMPGLTQKGSDLQSQLYPGGALGMAETQGTVCLTLSISSKGTAEFPRGSTVYVNRLNAELMMSERSICCEVSHERDLQQCKTWPLFSLHAFVFRKIELIF